MIKKYYLHNRIDSSNATSVEKEIKDCFSEGFPEELVLDASGLTYISSAGLRILLRLKKVAGCVRMIHVNRDVYEILEMTGMNQILEAERAMRQISIDGCPEIGRGLHGIVYRIAPDTIAKVYHPGESLENIRQERELAQWAFVRGLPTAIPYDVVRVGEQYGTVFELLNAGSAADYVMENPTNLEDYVRRSVSLLKQIHSIRVNPGELPDMKEQMLSWMESIRHMHGTKDYEELPFEICDRLEQMIRTTPDSGTLLHADFHLKNILICKDELMLIDMDTLCTGDPVFDLATIYNSYREFPSIDAEAAAFLGIDVQTAYSICDGLIGGYLDGMDPEEKAETISRAKIFGCVRIIGFMNQQKDAPQKEKIIKRCLQDITEALDWE